MDVIQKKLTALDIIFWLRENYKVGKSGSTSKNAVYQHYLDMCTEKAIEPSISATYFGKLVKRAFPDIKYNRKGPRGGTKQHYTHLKRMDPAKKDMERQLQQVPTELQQEYNYYHSINLEKEKEEMGGRMFGMFKMNREGAYVPSLSAMYASALEVEREEEMTRHHAVTTTSSPSSSSSSSSALPLRRSAYGREDEVDFLACLKPLAHTSTGLLSPSPSPSCASSPLPSSSAKSAVSPSFFPRLLTAPPEPASPSVAAYAAQAGGYPPPYYSGMAPPVPPNLTSPLPFDRDPSSAPLVWPSSSSSSSSSSAPSAAQRGLPPPLGGGSVPSAYHHPLHYLAATAPSAPGFLPTSPSPSSSPRGSYSHPHQYHRLHHQHHPPSHPHGGGCHSADIPFASLPPLSASPLPTFPASSSQTLTSSPHLYRSTPALSADADERREQTAQQREDNSTCSPPPLRHAP